jgi:CubicO group peptidase (beta-lactamase class C family)
MTAACHRQSQISRRAALIGGAASIATACTIAAPPVGGKVVASSALSRTAKAISASEAAGGPGQIFLWRDGKVLVDQGVGPGVTTSSLVPWASACKPTTVATVMRLVEVGEINLTDKVTKFVPAFGQNGKEDVTVWNLMTHTAALGGYDGPINLPTWDETIAKIVASPRAGARNQGAPPALSEKHPSYNPAGIWMLGEILRRVHNRPFADIIRSEMYAPLGMADCWNGMPVEKFDSYGARIVRGNFRGGAAGGEDGRAAALAGRAGAADASQGRAAALAARTGGGAGGGAPQTQRANAALSNPAGGAIGPVNQFARFYMMALNGGELDGRRILKSSTIAEMTRVQASDGGAWTFGLGFNINKKPVRQLSASEQALRYGDRPSADTWGHNGATGLIAFCDPRARIIAIFIGAPRTLSDGLYDDLGLT